jgi:hypothetical protein
MDGTDTEMLVLLKDQDKCLCRNKCARARAHTHTRLRFTNETEQVCNIISDGPKSFKNVRTTVIK